MASSQIALATMSNGRPSEDSAETAFLSSKDETSGFVERLSEDSAQVQVEKTYPGEARITVVELDEEPRSSNENTLTGGGEWRSGEDDTCTGEDSMTRPLKRQFHGYYARNKKFGKKHLGPFNPTRIKEELHKEIIMKPILQDKKTEWKLMGFVFILFVIIVAGLIIIYQFHREDLHLIYQGYNATFNKHVLHAEFRNGHGKRVLFGTMWKNFPERGQPFDCAYSDHPKTSGHLCLLWKNVKRLEVKHFEAGNSVCHRIQWTFLSQKASDHTDCYELGAALWYGGGILKNGAGSLENVSIPRQPFVTGGIHDEGDFGPVVERYWLSSEGVAIVAEGNSFLELSINALDELLNETDRQFCLHSEPENNPISGKRNTGLNYVVCSGHSVSQVRHDTIPLLLPERTQVTYPEFMFTSPVWSTWAYLKDQYNQTAIDEFLTQTVAAGFPRGLLLIDDGWEGQTGELEFTTSMFNDSRAFVSSVREKGFRISLQFRPEVSVRSKAFQNSTVQRYLVRDVSGEVPGLTQWWNGPHQFQWDRGLAGMVDVMDEGAEWLKERLDKLKEEYAIDMFHLAGAEVSRLPAQSRFSAAITDPNDYTRSNADLLAKFGLISITESASRCQNLSVLIRLRGGISQWDGIGGLRSVIPSAVTLGILGYPLFIPESVGGSAYNGFPSRELYLRWFQLSAFFPIMHLSIPPQFYDSKIQTITRNILEIRKNIVLPEILYLVNNSSKLVESPIVRPIWWSDPRDDEALRISTQFLVGNNILVAPILEEGATRRDIYLPKGVWHDALREVFHTGPLWLRSYQVRLADVAYFVRW